ncbi:MAG: hypothetical protein ACREUR_08915 [Nitrosospira sp.]
MTGKVSFGEWTREGHPDIRRGLNPHKLFDQRVNYEGVTSVNADAGGYP